VPDSDDTVGRVAVGAAFVLFDPAGKVLLVRQTYGRRLWALPGGLAEPGESPEETARRELLEETGLTVGAATLAGVYFQRDHELGPFLHIVFKAEWDPGQAPLMDSDEVDQIRFWPVTDLPRPHLRLTAIRIADVVAGVVRAATVGPPEWVE
jgi:ADP-ribose pyrophosphatase YjhB (NUDIX family)